MVEKLIQFEVELTEQHCVKRFVVKDGWKSTEENAKVRIKPYTNHQPFSKFSKITFQSIMNSQKHLKRIKKTFLVLFDRQKVNAKSTEFKQSISVASNDLVLLSEKSSRKKNNIILVYVIELTSQILYAFSIYQILPPSLNALKWVDRVIVLIHKFFTALKWFNGKRTQSQITFSILLKTTPGLYIQKLLVPYIFNRCQQSQKVVICAKRSRGLRGGSEHSNGFLDIEMAQGQISIKPSICRQSQNVIFGKQNVQENLPLKAAASLNSNHNKMKKLLKKYTTIMEHVHFNRSSIAMFFEVDSTL